MNAKQLLEHFERVADAPDSVARLKRLVIDLAVRGKLLPQVEEDESALALLRRTEAERIALGWEAKDCHVKSIDGECEAPFAVPSTWLWIRLGDTGKIASGNSINAMTREQLARTKAGLPFIATKDVGYGFDPIEYVNGLLVKEGSRGFKIAKANSVLICAEGGSAGRKIGITDRRVCFGNKLLANEPWDFIDHRFIAIVYLSSFFYAQFSSQMTGVIGGISIGRFLQLPFPLPPFAEQVRIADKVDDLMGLCDQVAAARTEREAARELLTAASLARLNKPDSETFVADVRFAIDALASLTARSEQIKQFRQAILNLAICGRIAERKPDEGEASTLVESIHADRRRLRNRWLDPDMKLVDFDVPSHWVWQSLDQIIVDGPQNGLSPRKSDRHGAPKAITLTATTSGRFDGRQFKRVEVKAADASGYWLEPGDLLFQRGNTPDYVGIAAIYDGPANEFLFPDLIIRVKVSRRMSNRFVHLWCIAPFARKYLTSNATGAQKTMPKINQRTLKAIPIAVPPIKEQERIVAEVDALMRLCDQLEESLTVADSARRHLLDAMLHEALAPVAKPSKEHARAAVSGYLVSRLAFKRNFGRTAHMKHLYFAESRLGLNLGGCYMREAAGPLDAGIYELEKRAESAGWYTHSVETLPSGNEKVSYQPGKALKAIAEEGITVLGRSRTEMDRLIDLMGDLKTESVEIIATLFAAWNDALLDGQNPDDNWVIKEVREHWHVSKQRFTPADLKKWLGWMRQNDVVPLGHAPRTMHQTTMEF